ncbi:MAG: hypothetical protein M3198_05315 [Actinomycetota bacterium]|nr:hypothetical protein [Actinomycetota bacterium]
MTTPVVTLDAVDALELGELLEFVRDWLQGDQGVAPSLARFGGLDPAELSADLSRFAFLLGGDGRLVVGEP